MFAQHLKVVAVVKRAGYRCWVRCVGMDSCRSAFCRWGAVYPIISAFCEKCCCNRRKRGREGERTAGKGDDCILEALATSYRACMGACPYCACRRHASEISDLHRASDERVKVPFQLVSGRSARNRPAIFRAAANNKRRRRWNDAHDAENDQQETQADPVG